MLMPTEITHIFTDLGGVLLTNGWDRTLRHKTAEHFGVDPAEMDERHHLTYDLGNAERFRDYAVLTVEKNRFGRDGAVLQFRTRFDQGRYEPDGAEVNEQLIDERVFRE